MNLRALYGEVFGRPYRLERARAERDADEAFLAAALPELLGLPQPASFFTLELYPHLIRRYHEWHRRQGLERAPEGGWRCC